MPKRRTAFDVFFAGATAFLAGVCFTQIFTESGWTRQDAILGAATLLGILNTVQVLRRLYRDQAV